MDYICDRCERYPCTENKTKLMYRCPAYVPKPKLVTNYDLLVHKSPEQLADWYFNEFFKSVPYCTKEECYQEDPCEKCLLEWLKQEVNYERSDQEHEDA